MEENIKMVVVIRRTVAVNSSPGPSRMMFSVKSKGGRQRIDQFSSKVRFEAQSSLASKRHNIVGSHKNEVR